jgi:hypothetical protein
MIYNTYTVTKYLLDNLVKENFTMHLHESIQTNSAHIKLDYGAANSIRIADTPGKHKFAHKFNVVIGLRETYERDGSIYYTPVDLDRMVQDITTNRNNRRNFVGVEKYEENIERYMAQFASQNGYWKSAKLVAERVSEAPKKLF